MANGTQAGSLLEVVDVAVHFGGIVALDGVSFSVRPGVIQGLIGPNGAGKTTLLDCLSRLRVPDAGDILFQGASILGTPAHCIAAMGISRTFQNLALFQTMSVLDNVMVGSHSRGSGGFLGTALRLPAARREEQRLRGQAWEIIDYLDLDPVARTRVGDLPFGTRKRVELARALAAHPSLLLLDEPAGGLDPDEAGELGRLIRRIREDAGITILLVEHHMSLVMGVSDYVVAIDFGRKIGEGTPEEVRGNPDVIRACPGTPH